MDPLARRVLARFIAAGYSGWDPPDDDPEDPDPSEEWDRIVALFPHSLQKLLGKPKQDVDRDRDYVSVSLNSVVELSEDSGIMLTVSVTTGTDADEDGLYGYSSESLEYALTTSNKSWDGKDERRLKHDLREFLELLPKVDPEAAKKL